MMVLMGNIAYYSDVVFHINSVAENFFIFNF